MSLPEIAEVAATGATKKFYDRFRDESGSALINLVWRHLATIPDAAEWCWEVVKASDTEPAVRAYDAASDVAAARVSCERPPKVVLHPRAAELISAYNRNNVKNAVRVICCLKALRGSLEIEHAVAGNLQQPRELTDTSLPPLPALSDLSEDSLSAVERLAQAGPASDSGVSPSLWRHLSLIEGQLEALETPVSNLLGSAMFRTEWEALVCFGSGKLVPRGPKVPEQLDLDKTEVALERFSRRISELVIVGKVLLSNSRVPSEARAQKQVMSGVYAGQRNNSGGGA